MGLCGLCMVVVWIMGVGNDGGNIGCMSVVWVGYVGVVVWVIRMGVWWSGSMVGVSVCWNGSMIGI